MWGDVWFVALHLKYRVLFHEMPFLVSKSLAFLSRICCFLNSIHTNSVRLKRFVRIKKLGVADKAASTSDFRTASKIRTA
jgi:hypothetical protein